MASSWTHDLWWRHVRITCQRPIQSTYVTAAPISCQLVCLWQQWNTDCTRSQIEACFVCRSLQGRTKQKSVKTVFGLIDNGFFLRMAIYNAETNGLNPGLDWPGLSDRSRRTRSPTPKVNKYPWPSGDRWIAVITVTDAVICDRVNVHLPALKPDATGGGGAALSVE